VLSALADVWDGRPDPGALVAVVTEPPPALPAGTCSTPRAWSSGCTQVAEGSAGALDSTAPRWPARWAGCCRGRSRSPADADVVLEHLDEHDWRAEVRVRCARGAVREVLVVVGVARDEPAVPGRPEAVHRWIAGLLEVAARLGGVVEVTEAVPDSQHAPRPRGVLTAERLPAVLAAVDLPL
jgi:hypothetical protein